MKKIILGLFVMLSALVLGTKALTVKAAATVTMTEGASMRLDDPAGLRFEAKVSEAVAGAKYGIVFANGEVAADQVVVGATGVVNAEVDEVKEDLTYAVSMVNIPERAFFSDITARAYILIDGVYTYSEAAVTRNINEVAKAYKVANPEAEVAFVNGVLSVAKLNLNGGTYQYANHDAMVEDFLNDFNTATGKSAQASGLYDAGNVFGTFFDAEGMLAKWGWALKLFIALGDQGYGYHASAKEQYEAFLAGNGSTVASQWAVRQAFQALMTLTKVGRYSGAACPDFGQYVVAKQIEGAINGGVEIVNLESGISVAYRKGYTFVGWFDAADNKVDVDTLTEGAELTAQWKINEYTINYNLDGGALAEDAAVTYTIEGLELPVPTKASMFFAGWYDNAEFSGDPVTSIKAGSTGDVELYAKWIAGEVTYVLNDGVWADSEIITSALKGKEQASITTTANSGFWGGYASNIYLFTKAGLTNAASALKVEITEQEDGSYLVTKVHNGSGYTAAGTYILLISDSFTGNSDTTTADVTTFKANVAEGQYVVFDGDPSTGKAGVKFYSATDAAAAKVSDITLAVVYPYTLSTKVEKAGYLFGGWYDNPELTGSAITEINESKTVYAKWTVLENVEVSVNFVLDGGYLPKDWPGAAASNTINISTYSNTGGASGTYLCDTGVTKNNSLRWQYKILLNYHADLDLYEVVAVDAATASAANVASAAGVTWTHALANANTNISTYASVGQYIALDKDNASVVVGSTNLVGSVYNLSAFESCTKVLLLPQSLPTPVKTGYTFKGWLCSLDGVVYTEFPGYTANPGAITYTAQWEANA